MRRTEKAVGSAVMRACGGSFLPARIVADGDLEPLHLRLLLARHADAQDIQGLNSGRAQGPVAEQRLAQERLEVDPLAVDRHLPLGIEENPNE